MGSPALNGGHSPDRPMGRLCARSGHSITAHYANCLVYKVKVRVPGVASMSTLISLNEVPQNLLYPAKWIELRAFASSDLMSLTLINAPYPDRDYPRDFFWGRDGSYEQAIRCYTIGRELLDQCRQLLIGRELTAIGTRPDGTRKMITSIEWTNTWPMFATNRATGPNSSYDDVEIVELSPLETPDERMLLDTVGWLRLQSPATLEQKKLGLLYQARTELDENITHAIFNAAYKAVFGRSRGRPRKWPRKI